MQVSELELVHVDSSPAFNVVQSEAGAHKEHDLDIGVPRHDVAEVPAAIATGAFAAPEVQAFHHDDAMAAGMICTILCLAFTALVVLVTGVTLWTMAVAG